MLGKKKFGSEHFSVTNVRNISKTSLERDKTYNKRKQEAKGGTTFSRNVNIAHFRSSLRFPDDPFGNGCCSYRPPAAPTEKGPAGPRKGRGRRRRMRRIPAAGARASCASPSWSA